MRIAIIGDGIGGRSMYRFLEIDNLHDVEIFGEKHHTRCGISPCGWGVYTPDFYAAHNWLDLPVTTHIKTFTRLQVSDVEFPCDLTTFDKPAFLDQMCPAENIRYDHPGVPSDYDLMIDATGTARAVLPPIRNDLVSGCIQGRYRVGATDRIAVNTSVATAYSWTFPISDTDVHIGELTSVQGLSNIDKARELAGANIGNLICECKSKTRRITPMYCDPIVHRNIVGIGESVGCISPICCAGVIPAIRSARLLAGYIDNLPAYEKILLHDFAYLDREVKILEKLSEGKWLNLTDARSMQNNAASFGLFLGWKEVLKLIGMMGSKLL